MKHQDDTRQSNQNYQRIYRYAAREVHRAWANPVSENGQQGKADDQDEKRKDIQKYQQTFFFRLISPD